MTRWVRKPEDKDVGYRLPDTMPNDFVCARVYIPADNLLIAAFWSQVEQLTRWLAWERGGTKARDAALLWKTAWGMSREAWEGCQGECGIVDVRQSETTPCLLEKKIDCTEYEQFADMRLCVPKMRLHGGVIQQDTTGGGSWVDAGDPDAPYDDRQDGTYTPAWTTPPEGQSGECLAAANAIAFARSVVTAYANMVDGGSNFITSIMYWFSSIQLIAEIKNIVIEITVGAQAILDAFIGDWADVSAYDFSEDVLCILSSAYSEDGSMSGGQWATIGTSIQDVIDAKTIEYEKTALRAASLLFFSLGPIGMSRVAGFAGIVSADCSECGEWEQIIDLTTGLHGWTIPTYQGYPMGSWENGVGVKVVWINGYYRAEVDMTSLSGTETFIKAGVDFQFNMGESNTKSRHLILQNGASEVWRYIEQTGTTEVTSGYEEEEDIKIGDWFYAYQTDDDGQAHNPGDIGTSYIKEIRLFGNGINPFL